MFPVKKRNDSLTKTSKHSKKKVMSQNRWNNLETGVAVQF